MMTMGQLHERIGHAYSIAHLRRWADAGLIPATYKRAGKHFRFKPCPRLHTWINKITCRVDLEGRRREERAHFPTARLRKREARRELRYLNHAARLFIRDSAPHLKIKDSRELSQVTDGIFQLSAVLRDLLEDANRRPNG